MQPPSQLRRNIAISFASQAALLVLSLFATRLIFRQLGADVFGLISFSLVLTSALIFLTDMGISVTVTREIAAHRGHDTGYVDSLISSVTMFAWALFALSGVIAVLMTPLIIERWVQLVSLSPDDAQRVMQIICASLLLAIPRGMYGAVVAGYERMDLWNIANISATGIQQLGMIVVLSIGGGIYDVALWYGISAIVGLVSFLAIAMRLAGAALHRMRIHPAVIRKNVAFGSRLFANSIVGYFLTQADKWVISKYLPIGVLGYYGFSQGLVAKAVMVPNALSSASFPSLSSMMADESERSWMGRYIKLENFCYYVFIPMVAAVGMLGIVLIEFVFSADIARLMWIPLLLLSAGQYLVGVVQLPYWLAVAMRKPEIWLRAHVLALFIVLPFVVFMTMAYGVIGAAASTILYGCWLMIYFIPRFAVICLGHMPGEWYRRFLAFTAMACVAYGGPWLIAWAVGQGLTLGGLTGSYLMGTVFFLAGGWLFLGRELRDVLQNEIRKILLKVGNKSYVG